MLITSKTSSNILLDTATSTNPQFIGATVTSAPSAPVSQQVTATPPPYTTSVSIQPPSYSEEVTLSPPPYVDRSGPVVTVPPIKKTITVTPPAIMQSVTVQPPDVSFQKTVATPAGAPVVSNLYGAVGIVQLTPLRLVALVRPNVVAGALHYALPVGAVVRFIGASGFEDRTISKVAYTLGDLQLYYLDQSVSTVKPAPICVLGASAMANRAIVTFGLIGSRAGDGSGWVPAAATNKIGRVMIDANAGTWNATCSMLSFQLEPGDSGSPSFVVEDSGPTFLGSTRKISSTYEVNVAAPAAAAIASL